MSVSLQYIARVLNRSSVSLHEYASNVLFSAAVPEIQFSDNFLIEVRHHYIKLFTRLLLSSITYMQYFQRSTMLCIDVEHAVDVLRSDSTFNSMQSPPISLLINKTFNDDENEATGDSDKTLRDEEGSRESGSFVGIEGKEGEDVDEGGDGDDEEDDDDEDDDEEDDYEEDDDEDDEDEYDEEDEEVDELWERESLDSAQKMSIFLGEECAFINSIDPSYLPPEFIKLYQDVSNDNRIYLETVSLTALRMMYEYTNDQIALSLEHPSTRYENILSCR